jgi:hypothetical protein
VAHREGFFDGRTVVDVTVVSSLYGREQLEYFQFKLVDGKVEDVKHEIALNGPDYQELVENK